ncbi:hypothetical protein H4R20_003296 [Coemansia guatemalensis]|uniref:Uncharacterized protein n=1 Tax=Coemansia guatemalensis TaxID=2761395 RepID=A0A9W8LRI8_9FUNG|nr:hypothetical protein H4R20_003296 [Coemansia guatemalensis]
MAPQIPDQIQFQLRDVAQGLTYSASTTEYVFADDPMPAGTDNGQVTLVVDMSENGDQPVSVKSLSSSLMVSDIRWTPSEPPGRPAPTLTVDGIAHESVELVKKALGDLEPATQADAD